ncbi:MAG: sigma-70 family RNA polymerase sigma factor [Candidatus Marinimicrobia bacterium]|nr:sigma-70 family RNA polymerase sigma factor [Candidatus Neomarinimicrobiota bacterium]
MTLDDQIINLYQHGFHRQAMERIIDSWGNELKQWLYTFVCNEDDADDLAQEVFIKVYTHFHQFRGDSTLKTWIFHIARNAAVSYLTSRYYKESKMDPELPDTITYKEARNDVDDIDKDICRSVIRQLPTLLRTPLVMHSYMNCKQEEIARILNIPLNTVKARIRRARLSVILVMEKQGFISLTEKQKQEEK